jgi:hypothetical protein
MGACRAILARVVAVAALLIATSLAFDQGAGTFSDPPTAQAGGLGGVFSPDRVMHDGDEDGADDGHDEGDGQEDDDEDSHNDGNDADEDDDEDDDDHDDGAGGDHH